MLRHFLSFRWILTTLLVAAAVAGMIRLGIWQLDRNQQRAAFNANLEIQLAAPPLDLNQPLDPLDLPNMEYRQVTARGVYEPSGEIVLRNQAYESQPGYHVLTPLRLDGSETIVLVDRGFIPLDQGTPEGRAPYAAPSGEVQIQAIIRQAQNNRRFGVPDPTLAPGQERLDAWNAVNLLRIQEQFAGPLLPVYLQLTESPTPGQMPYADPEIPVIDPGPHIGYAVQWFSFAAVLAIGYPFFLRKNLPH